MSEETLHILHIDDDEDDRFFLMRAARATALPIVITNAESGAQALVRLRTAPKVPDMLLLDIRMPAMSGFDLLQVLKETIHAHVPVVMYSNSDQPSDVERARALGAHAYCLKPSGLQHLVQFMRRLYNAWLKRELPCEWPPKLGSK